MFKIDAKSFILMVVTFFLTIIGGVIGFAIPLSQKIMIDRFIEGEIFSVIPLFCLILLALILASWFTGLVKDLATNAFRYRYIDSVVGRVSVAYFSSFGLDDKKRSDPVFIGRVSTVLNTLPESVSQLLNFWCAILTTPILGLYMLYIVSVDMLVIALSVFAFQFVVNTIFSPFMQKKSNQKHREKGVFSLCISDLVYGLNTLYSAPKENALQELNIKQLDRYTFSNFDVERLRNIQEVVQNIGVSGGMFAVLWFGAHNVINGTMTYGDLLFCVIALEMTLHPTRDIASANRAHKDIKAQKALLNEMLTPCAVDEPSEYRQVNQIELKNAAFSYGEKEVISHVNALFEKGKMYLIRGPSGAGKSTLIKGMIGLISPTSGDVLCNEEILRSTLLGSMGYLSSDDCLFHGTLRDNFTLFGEHDVCMKQLSENMGVAHADVFFNTYPDRLDTKFPLPNAGLSGGQERRMCLARFLTISAERDVWFLDEPTSNLDAELEDKVFDGIASMKSNKIIIVVSHSEHAKKHFDHVFLVENKEVFCEK